MTTDHYNRPRSPINKIIEFGPIWSNFLTADGPNSAEMAAIVECANNLVDETIERAIEKLAIGAKPAAVDWPISAKMSATTGLDCIERTMQIWKLQPALRGWKYYAEFIGLENEQSSVDVYNYQVRWSYPTFAYPEPRVIVNVYFALEATRRTDRPNHPVDVKYVFEGNKFVHRPSIEFRPKWIYDVLDIKTIVFESLKF